MITELANHLLQSTVFAAAAAGLVLLLRRNPARPRYWVWLISSIKFLIPLSLLVSAGRWVSGLASARVHPTPRMLAVANEISQPFSAPSLDISSLAAAPPMLIWPTVLIAVWGIGFFAVVGSWFVRSRRLASLVRGCEPVRDDRINHVLERLAPGKHIDAVSVSSQIEPGVFGIFRPVLALPSGITEQLDDAQLETVLAHEISHLRDRDNLTAAIHMTVEAIFWFHPLVWWIGARLVEERERACDESVVQMGCDPELYAETILRVCRLYLASPLVCAAGISGSDLRKRIETIMQQPILDRLSRPRKVILGTAVLFALALPMAAGIVSGVSLARVLMPIRPLAHQAYQPELVVQSTPAPARPTSSQSARLQFESVVVKAESPYVSESMISGGPGTRYPRQMTFSAITPFRLIARAYIGIDAIAGPEWLDSERYSIIADVAPSADVDQANAMLRNLLNDRFHLVFHRETRRFTGWVLRIDPFQDLPARSERDSGSQTVESLPPSTDQPAGTNLPLAYGAAWLTGMDPETSILDGASRGPRVIDRTGKPGAYDRILGSPVQLLAFTNPRSLETARLMFDSRFGGMPRLERVNEEPISVLVVDRLDRRPAEK